MNSPKGAAASAGSWLDVLLIEDDRVDEMAALRAVAEQALPYRMSVARSVDEARCVLGRRRFDVVLADYRLRDGTSFDLVDVFAEQVVIFLTGGWDEAASARALELGLSDNILAKDVDRRYLELLRYRVEATLRQRRTECALRQSEARLTAILENAPMAISAWDRSGQLVLSNPRHAQLLRTTTGVGIAQMVEKSLECEEVVTLADGSARTMLTVHFPMPGADGTQPMTGKISVDITERKQAEEQIRELAYFDALTGLPNRRMLQDRCRQAFATSAHHGTHGALFFIDLDHFKALNDTLGHDHGDMLLVAVAQRLLACVRAEDTVARIGGDEFVVMAVSLSGERQVAREQALSIGAKIVEAVGRPCALGHHMHRVTPSVGVSTFFAHELTIDDVIKRADQAMYLAKAAGRGTVRLHEP